MHRHTRRRHLGAAKEEGAEEKSAAAGEEEIAEEDEGARGGGIVLVVGKPGTALTPPLDAAARGAQHALTTNEVRGIMHALGYRSDAESESLLVAGAPNIEGCVLVFRRVVSDETTQEVAPVAVVTPAEDVAAP